MNRSMCEQRICTRIRVHPVQLLVLPILKSYEKIDYNL